MDKNHKQFKALHLNNSTISLYHFALIVNAILRKNQIEEPYYEEYTQCRY